MFSSNPRPKWWQVYLTLPLLLLLFFAEARLKLSVRGHQLIEIGIALLVYGLIHLWLKANAKALSNMDRENYFPAFRVYRIPPVQLPEPGSEKRPMLGLPDSEIHRVLGNTFKIDYIDAECIEVEALPQELKKD